MNGFAKNFLILGTTTLGETFRPSDWAERLCGIMSALHQDNRMSYSPYVRPGSYEGRKCVCVDARLYELEPLAYQFVVNFARDNQLVTLYKEESD
jgi:hypothetical protein